MRMIRLRQHMLLLRLKKTTAVATSTLQPQYPLSPSCRTFVSKAEKRVLTQQQVAGPGDAPPVTPPAAAVAAATPKAAAAAAASTAKTADPFTFSNNPYAMGALAVTVLGGGIAYYLRFHSGMEVFQTKSSLPPVESPVVVTQSLPEPTTPEPVPEIVPEPEPTVEVVESVVAEEEIAPLASVVETPPVEEPTIIVEEHLAAEETVLEPVGNRVIAIQVPPIDSSRPPQTIPSVPTHPEGGHRVAMSIIPETPPPAAALPTPTAFDAAQELDNAIHQEAVHTLQRAQQALRSTLEETWLQDLEQLSPTQLRIRIVQLAKELEERTKWEAVRLKEFLAMKEDETAERYKIVLQQQRQELESLLARRLREQEKQLNKQYRTVLEEKDQNIQKIVQEVVDAQNAEHQAELERMEVEKDKEATLKYQNAFATQVQETQQQFVQELETKVAEMEALSLKLKELEVALETSRTFESGSLKAHRLSAAALAFSEKLETSQSAALELELLKSAAENNRVIVSAVSALPASVKAGVPTLPELQAKFETVHKKSRQAALVPTGRLGLEGQFLGTLFATLKSAPNPEEPAPEDAKDSAEYILARARRHVQLGDLEHAVEELNKLPSSGQAAFTVKDWKKDALERVTVNKALRSIKLECALLNSAISSGATAAAASPSEQVA